MSRYGFPSFETDEAREKSVSNLELLKLILPFASKYAKSLFLALSLLPIGAFALSIQPIIIQKLIDGPLKAKSLEGLESFALIFIAAIAVQFTIQIFQVYTTNNVGQKIIADIRIKLFEHLEKLPMSFFDRNPVGKSVTRLTNDMENLGESFTAGIIGTAADSINIIGVIIFMFYLHWQLSIAVLILLIPMALIANHFQSIYRKANLIARKELSQLNSFLQQNIVGISVVQLLNSAKKNMDIYDENNKRFVKANDKTIEADASFSAGIEFISIFAMATLIFLSRELISLEGLSIGIVIAFLQYAQSLFEPIRNLSDKFTIIQAGFTSAERVSHLLNEPITISDPEEECQKTSMNESQSFEIEFRDVWFKYKDEEILKGLSFKIDGKEKVAIVGKTGAGKSTIIKLLTRLYEPQQGCILINGVDIRRLKQQELRELVAVIHQDSYIFAGNVESNINLKRDPSKINLDLAKPFMAACELKLDHELSERASNISSGEEQVISFARAVVSNPQVLVLDEATAKIDLKTEKTLQNALDEFIQSRSTIIIAHRLETIKKMDRLLVLADGKLAEAGKHQELIDKQGVYYNLYKSRL